MAPARERCRTRSMGLEEDALRPRSGNARVNKPTPKRRSTQVPKDYQNARTPGRIESNTARESLAAIATEAELAMGVTAESTASERATDMMHETQDAVAGAAQENISFEHQQDQSAPIPASCDTAVAPTVPIDPMAIEEHWQGRAAASPDNPPPSATVASPQDSIKAALLSASRLLTIEGIRLDHTSQATQARAARELYEEIEIERTAIATRVDNAEGRLAACQRELRLVGEQEANHMVLQDHLRRASSGPNACASFGDSLLDVNATLDKLSTSKADLNAREETLQSEIEHHTEHLGQVEVTHSRLKVEMHAVEEAEACRSQKLTAVRILQALTEMGVDQLAELDHGILWALEGLVVPDEVKPEGTENSPNPRHGNDVELEDEDMGAGGNDDEFDD